MPSPTEPTALLIDAHVHLHDCFTLQSFLDAVYKNFGQQNKQLNQSALWILLLSEVSGVNAFTDLAQQKENLNAQLSGWQIEPTREPTSLRLVHQSGQVLYIMSGRQIVTQEKIEVLALITKTTVDDGLPLTETLNKVNETEALTVLPWGAGKWIGSRGEQVQQQIEAAKVPLFIGDNGNRPSVWPLPDFCRQQPRLPGTDPLPMAHEAKRVGSFGLTIQSANLDSDRPGESLKQLLRQPKQTLTPYGNLQSPLAFIRNQVQLRLS